MLIGLHLPIGVLNTIGQTRKKQHEAYKKDPEPRVESPIVLRDLLLYLRMFIVNSSFIVKLSVIVCNWFVITPFCNALSQTIHAWSMKFPMNMTHAWRCSSSSQLNGRLGWVYRYIPHYQGPVDDD